MAQSGDIELLHSAKADKFFDSFQLLNLPAQPLNENSRTFDLGRAMGAGIVNLAIVAVAIVAIVLYLRRKKSGQAP
jgi:hypothetical protein